MDASVGRLDVSVLRFAMNGKVQDVTYASQREGCRLKKARVCGATQPIC